MGYILNVFMEKTNYAGLSPASFSAGLQLFQRLKFHIFVEGECLLHSVSRPTRIFLTTAGLIDLPSFHFPRARFIEIFLSKRKVFKY